MMSKAEGRVRRVHYAVEFAVLSEFVDRPLTDPFLRPVFSPKGNPPALPEDSRSLTTPGVAGNVAGQSKCTSKGQND